VNLDACGAPRRHEVVRTGREGDRPQPSFGISPSYAGGISITALFLTVHIWHRLRQAILSCGALARRGLHCLDRGHDLLFPYGATRRQPHEL